MVRRLEPFDDCIFLTTLSIDNLETGDVDQHRFHARGSVRNWARLLELADHNGIVSPGSEVASVGNWSTSDVLDPLGGLYQSSPVVFNRSYSGYAIRSERILRIQESYDIAVETLVFNGRDGQVIYRFDETELDHNFSDFVQVNLNGAQQWLVRLGVSNRRLAATLTGLDALVSKTDDTGIGWRDTGDIGTLA